MDQFEGHPNADDILGRRDPADPDTTTDCTTVTLTVILPTYVGNDAPERLAEVMAIAKAHGIPVELHPLEPVGRDLVRLGPPSNGSRIHRAECPYAKRARNPLAWTWAEGRPLSHWTTAGHLHACQHCRPDLPRPTEGATP